MEAANPIVDRALALAGDGRDGSGHDGEGRDGALGDLIRLAGDEPSALADAQQILVARIRQRSDDFAATGGLTLVNAAMAHLGWEGEFTWKPRGQK